jgi:hypothetical protein
MKQAIPTTLFITAALLLLPGVAAGAYGQTERWAHTYDGPGHLDDTAPSAIVGNDGHVYVAGYSYGDGTDVDIVVLSLDAEGRRRWVYRYDNGGNDGANAVVQGPGGGLYVVGGSNGSDSEPSDMVVIRLGDDGAEQWVYRYDGPARAVDLGTDIAVDVDGNLYATGYSWGEGTSGDAVVVSLTAGGIERWVYRYDGAEHGIDRAYCVTVGHHQMVYAGGTCRAHEAIDASLVLALNTSGEEKWVYASPDPFATQNAVYDLTIDAEGELLTAGTCASMDFAVRRMDWKTGAVLWTWTRPTATINLNRANAVVCDHRGNVCAAGAIDLADEMNNDFVVVGLDLEGNQRWLYGIDGPAGDWDEAASLALDDAGSVIAAGYTWSSVMCDAFAVSLDDQGGELWSRTWSGPAEWTEERFTAVARGGVGRFYLGGMMENGSGRDITVLGLDTDVTLGGAIACDPTAGTMPLDVSVSVVVANPLADQIRRASMRLDLDLADGSFFSRWRAGYANIQPLGQFSTAVPLTIPAEPGMAGEHGFRLVIEDTTPAPYNQPPCLPSGDTDTAACTVTAVP